MVQGSGYLGSSALETSVAGQEILPSPPAIWTNVYKFYKFSFINNSDCTVIINSGSPIFLRAYQGMNVSQNDKEISSFKIVENGIKFSWMGAY